MNLYTTNDIKSDVSRKIHGSVSESFYGSLNKAQQAFERNYNRYK